MSYQAVTDSLNIDRSINSIQSLIDLSRQGLKRSSVDSLAAKLAIPTKELAQFLHISERTLQRYAPDKELSSEASDRLIQIARVYVRTVEVFEDEEAALSWLKYPVRALGDVTPLSCLDSYSGIELVTDELGRIDYGVYA